MGPFIKTKNNTTKMMLRVVIALIPIILFSFYKNGILPYIKGYVDIFDMFKPLIIILVATFSTFIFETLLQLIFDKDKNIKNIIFNSYSYMPGLFLGLILPINTPISILIFGSFVASFIGKYVFGGFGKNIFNPALIGRLFIISTYALVITEAGGYLNSFELDTISGATPLSNASLITGIGTYAELVKQYGSLLDFFIGTIPGCIGETSALLCLLAFIYLTVTKTIKWRIPVMYVGTVFVMTFIIGLFNGVSIWYPVFQILSGGLMFGSVFMATDPVTSPITKSGQVIYGLGLGILTVVLRYLTPYPEGVLTSILTMNMLVFIIDSLGVKIKFNKNKIIIPVVVLSIIMISMSFVIGNKLKSSITKKDTSFEIVSKDIKGKNATYVVLQQGYSSKIKIEVIINNDKIDNIEILEANDSFFGKVTDSNYTETLKNNQNDLEDCDTVSGATISSTAVKKAIINVLADYRGEA